MTSFFPCPDGIAEAAPCRCADCGWQGRFDETKSIAGAEQRLTPGCEVPAGECPKCGVLAYLVKAPKKAETMAHVRALGELAGALERAEKATRAHRHMKPSERAMTLADIARKKIAIDKAAAALIQRDG